MVLYGKVFGRKSEGVPTHGVKHVIALHTLFASDYVKSGIGTGMAHMKSLTGGIGELNQSVIFRFCVIVCGSKGLFFIPYILPLFFNGGKIVTFHFFLLYFY